MSNGQGSYYSKKTFRFLLEKRKLGKENLNGAWSRRIEHTAWAPRYQKKKPGKVNLNRAWSVRIELTAGAPRYSKKAGRKKTNRQHVRRLDSFI